MVDRLDTLFEFLVTYPQFHARDSAFSRFAQGLTNHAFHESQPVFEAGQKEMMAKLGFISLSYEKMGAIDSIYDVPLSFKEDGAFVRAKPVMPW